MNIKKALFLEAEADRALDKKRYYAEEFKKDPSNIALANEAGLFDNIRRGCRADAKRLRKGQPCINSYCYSYVDTVEEN